MKKRTKKTRKKTTIKILDVSLEHYKILLEARKLHLLQSTVSKINLQLLFEREEMSMLVVPYEMIPYSLLEI
jgi:hypothetical protein